MNRLGYFILLFLIGFALTASAQQFSVPIKVNDDVGTTEERSPMMHLDRNGTIYISWVKGEGAGSSIYISRSTDGGMTFLTPVLACANANSNSDMQRTAKFVIDTKGGIHFVWMATRVNKQPDVWYIHSTDQGMTWTSPVSLSDDESKYAQDFPAIACDSSDNLYVSYLDFREPAESGQPTHGHLYFTKSTNGGATWSKHKKADVMPNGIGGTCECCSQHIAVSPAGNIYIAFRSSMLDANENNIRDICLARSIDKGETFLQSLVIQDKDWILMACPMKGPNIALDETETAHIVWCDARDNISHLYYASASTSATSTPKNTRFDSVGSQSPNFPDITLYGKGTYRATSYQTSNYGTCYLLYKDNVPLINNKPLPGGSEQKNVCILFGPDGTRYLVWQDSKLGNADIYFCKETSPLESASVNQTRDNASFSIYPNPISKEDRTLTITYETKEISMLRIMDILGREMYRVTLSPNETSQKVELPLVVAGNYYCALNSGNKIQTKILAIY